MVFDHHASVGGNALVAAELRKGLARHWSNAPTRQRKIGVLRTVGQARPTAGGSGTGWPPTDSEAERDCIAGELARAVERRTVAETEVRLLREAENARQQLGRWRRAWRGWRGR